MFHQHLEEIYGIYQLPEIAREHFSKQDSHFKVNTGMHSTLKES